MFRGFYTLTSSLLTESRKLDVVSNNFANISTPGYKSDQLLSSTFGEAMTVATANNIETGMGAIGESGSIAIVDTMVTDFSEGNIESTGYFLDFAILGEGFFAVQDLEGNTYYTRNGAFGMEQNGDLLLQGAGQVIGEDGPLNLSTTNFRVDRNGEIRHNDTNEVLGKISVFQFETTDDLIKVNEGIFQTEEAPLQAENGTFDMLWKSLESSNVDPADEMISLMQSQRTIQGATQMLKMVDQLVAKANEIGRV